MSKFIVGTFLILGFGFYELSGGADFEPAQRPIEPTVVSTKSIDIVPFDEPVVSRAVAPVAPIAAEVVAPSVPETPVVLEVAPAVVEAAEPVITLDLREVAGARVNMRAGPSTNDTVLDTLVRGTETEVLEVNASGWARVRVTDTDQIGWMAERFLSDS